MKIKKTLAFLGTVAATGLVGAASLALAYAPRAQGIRDRLRGAYDDLVQRVRGKEVESESSEETENVARTAEHTIEHGAEGRARAADRSHKPHVASAFTSTSLHPMRARRHA